MIVETYQSMLVLRKLKAGEVYRALPSISLDRAYRCLADMLGIHCECPIFGVLRFHRKCSDGKLNGLIQSIKRQKHPIQYRVPQVILEEIRPEWLVKYQAKK